MSLAKVVFPSATVTRACLHCGAELPANVVNCGGCGEWYEANELQILLASARELGLLSSSPKMKKTFHFRVPRVMRLGGNPLGALVGSLVLSTPAFVINSILDGRANTEFQSRLKSTEHTWKLLVYTHRGLHLPSGVTIRAFSTVFEQRFIPEVREDKRDACRSWARSLELEAYNYAANVIHSPVPAALISD